MGLTLPKSGRFSRAAKTTLVCCTLFIWLTRCEELNARSQPMSQHTVDAPTNRSTASLPIVEWNSMATNVRRSATSTSSYTILRSLQECPSGEYLTGSSCQPCPEDEYAPVRGMKKCLKCPVNSGTLKHLGADSVDDCACPEGLHMDINNNTCVPCPPNMYCPANNSRSRRLDGCSETGDLHEQPEGFWARSDSVVVTRYDICPNRTACRGLCGECSGNFRGVMCAHCASGYSRNHWNWGSECRSCLHPAAIIVIYLVTLIAYAASALLVCKLALKAFLSEKTDPSLTYEFLPKLKFLVFWAAIWTSLGFASSGGAYRRVDYDKSSSIPPRATDILLFSSALLRLIAVSLPVPIGVLPFDCVTAYESSALYWQSMMAFVTPWTLLGIFFGGWSIVYQHSKRKLSSVLQFLDPSSERADLVKRVTGRYSFHVFYIFFLLYPLIARLLCIPLQCRFIFDSTSVINWAPDISCDGRIHKKMKSGFVIPGLVIWLIGFPTAILAISVIRSLRAAKTMITAVKASSSAHLPPFLFLDSEGSSTYWEAVRISIILIVIWVSGDQQLDKATRCCCISVVLCLFCMMLVNVRPYRMPPPNNRSAWYPKWVVTCWKNLHIKELFFIMLLVVSYQVEAFSEAQCSYSLGLLVFIGTCTVIQYIAFTTLVLDLLVEIKRICWPPKFEAENSEESVLEEKTILSTRLSPFIEKILEKAVEISPFPEEAIAQLIVIANCPSLISLTLQELCSYVFESGHIELQGQTIYKAFPTIQYLTATNPFCTEQELAHELVALLKSIAHKMEIEEEVCVATHRAKAVLQRVDIVRTNQIEEVEDTTYDWKKLLGASTDDELVTKWLLLKNDLDLDGVAKRRMLFLSEFPDASPIAYQDELYVPPCKTAGSTTRAFGISELRHAAGPETICQTDPPKRKELRTVRRKRDPLDIRLPS